MSDKFLQRHRYSKGVQQEMEDVDYWSKLDPASKDWMEQFMYEFYGNGFYHVEEEQRILQTEEQLSEARRNNNNTNRDALLKSTKSGKLDWFEPLKFKFVDSDKTCEWETLYKQRGYEPAVKKLTRTVLENLGIKVTSRALTVLCNYYLAMTKLGRMLNKDEAIQFKQCFLCEENKPVVQFKDDYRTTDGKRKYCQTCEEK